MWNISEIVRDRDRGVAGPKKVGGSEQFFFAGEQRKKITNNIPVAEIRGGVVLKEEGVFQPNFEGGVVVDEVP